jgi:hypothetical protein
MLAPLETSRGRFTGTFTDGGDTIIGASQLRKADDRWNDDLKITYRRARLFWQAPSSDAGSRALAGHA